MHRHHWNVSVRVDTVEHDGSSAFHHKELPTRTQGGYCGSTTRGNTHTLSPINNCEGRCSEDEWCRRERSKYYYENVSVTDDMVVAVTVQGPIRTHMLSGLHGCSDELFGVLRGPAVLPMEFTFTGVVNGKCRYSADVDLLVGGRYSMIVWIERIFGTAEVDPDISRPNRTRICARASKSYLKLSSVDNFWPLNATGVYLGVEVSPRTTVVHVEGVGHKMICEKVGMARRGLWVHHNVLKRSMKRCKRSVRDWPGYDNYIWFAPKGGRTSTRGVKELQDTLDLMAHSSSRYQKRGIMFIGDSTVEEVYKFWGASGLADLFGARDLSVEFKSVWGTFDRMYSDARNPFLCEEKVMTLNGWRRVEDVAHSVEQLNPSVVILGENLHTLKKVGVNHYEIILDRLLSVITSSCPDCLVLLLPTKQPVGRLCPCGKASGISSCAYDIFYSRKRLRRANEVAMEVAERYGVKVLWDVYEMTLARQELSRDGIHWGSSFFLCEDGWCPEVSCRDYEQGHWRPFPEGYAVTNSSPEGMGVIVTQRNNFLADLYYPSVMAITSEMILDEIEDFVLHRAMSRSMFCCLSMSLIPDAILSSLSQP
ncbi:Poly [ADP-ribose] polymerase 2 [Perkinsus olseni]|uniref:Poly [ADP-ribose] polymerase 2 n=1 Tax=Perkinsus olseni TaxID=32597 RepID=A0A7J6PZQ7_PEROL|nr:Poly [ADP-ribose] polymerase 2 [Perkinsus olseni]